MILLLLFCSLYQGKAYAFSEGSQHRVLRGGWYWYEPYQYLNRKTDKNSLVGLDVQITKEIAKEIDVELSIKEADWNNHINSIESGEIDFAAGASYSEQRSQFAYFSIPYRYEENSFFVQREKESEYKFTTIAELISILEKKQNKIGVVEGFVYADKQINQWIHDPSNKDFIVFSKEDRENVYRLSNGEISGFFADRISGSTAVWRALAGEKITEIKLGIKTPIHFIFSKKTVDKDTVDRVNQAILHLKDGQQFGQIISAFLYPVLLLQTVDTIWFRLIEITGMIAMAISGLVIAYRDRSTLFGALVFAFLPSLGGSVVRDLVFDRFPVRAMSGMRSITIVLCVFLIGYIIVRLYDRYHERVHIPFDQHSWMYNILAISEGLGLAAFTISGIIITVVAKITPLWLWGPFFALVTGSGGGILRDLLSKNRNITALKGGLMPEIAITWGLFLSIFLTFQSRSVETDSIKYALIITMVGIFVTRICIYIFKVPNLQLRKPEKKL